MLVLTRKTQQQIQIGPHITITILKVKGQAIRLGIDAPRDVTVLRAELADKLAVRADAATVKAAQAASERERQRAIGGPDATASAPVASVGTATAADIVAPLTTLLRCRTSRVAGQRLGTRNRRRLMAVTSAVGVES
jgi:carbon storage regulator CsrA